MKQWNEIIANHIKEKSLFNREDRESFMILDKEDWSDFRKFVSRIDNLPENYTGVVRYMGVVVQSVDN